MAVNKVIYSGRTLIDLTGDTVDAEHILAGYTTHDKSGELIEGTCTYDANTSDANAVVNEILAGRTAYVRGIKLTGGMPNNACHNDSISTYNEEIIIPRGYHDGSGVININATEQQKIIPANIKKGISILGIIGTCEPSSDVTAAGIGVTPTTEEQVVLPPSGFDYLSQVVVAAIPYSETDNSAGGVTVTIAG